jgi:hypothetical protein
MPNVPCEFLFLHSGYRIRYNADARRWEGQEANAVEWQYGQGVVSLDTPEERIAKMAITPGVVRVDNVTMPVELTHEQWDRIHADFKSKRTDGTLSAFAGSLRGVGAPIPSEDTNWPEWQGTVSCPVVIIVPTHRSYFDFLVLP